MYACARPCTHVCAFEFEVTPRRTTLSTWLLTSLQLSGSRARYGVRRSTVPSQYHFSSSLSSVREGMVDVVEQWIACVRSEDRDEQQRCHVAARFQVSENSIETIRTQRVPIRTQVQHRFRQSGRSTPTPISSVESVRSKSTKMVQLGSGTAVCNTPPCANAHS